jgi:hypothetical protein
MGGGDAAGFGLQADEIGIFRTIFYYTTFWKRLQ